MTLTLDLSLSICFWIIAAFSLQKGNFKFHLSIAEWNIVGVSSRMSRVILLRKIQDSWFVDSQNLTTLLLSNWKKKSRQNSRTNYIATEFQQKGTRKSYDNLIITCLLCLKIVFASHLQLAGKKDTNGHSFLFSIDLLGTRTKRRIHSIGCRARSITSSSLWMNGKFFSAIQLEFLLLAGIVSGFWCRMAYYFEVFEECEKCWENREFLGYTMLFFPAH